MSSGAGRAETNAAADLEGRHQLRARDHPVRSTETSGGQASGLMIVVRRATLVIAAGVAIAACAHVPTGPSVMVLAGSGKTVEQFRTDDAACRQTATHEVESTKGGEVPAQRRYDMTYLQCMYAQGHQIPAPGQRPTDTSSSTAVPPGTPTAAPATWPPTKAQIDCEQSGGVWRAALNFCEFPAPDFPSRRWR